MIIRTLYMESFLSHAETKIDFDNGINVIVGKNGAGKTSIFEGIKFALFGLQRNGRDLLQYGKKHGKVRLEFKIGDILYAVERTLERAGARIETKGAVLESGNVMLAEGATSVSKEIGKIIGVSDEVFMNSVFIEQGQIDALIMRQKSKRLDLFNEILGLQNLQKVYDRLNDFKKQIELSINAKKSLEEIYQEDLERKRTIDAMISDLNKQLESVKIEFENSRVMLESLAKKFQEFQDIKIKKIKLESEHGQMERTALKLSEQIKTTENELKSLEPYSEKLRSLSESKNYRFRSEISEFIRNKENLEFITKQLIENTNKIQSAKENERR
ncbi:MAG: AAA family ATPase [Thermoplasmataceae archaeon]